MGLWDTSNTYVVLSAIKNTTNITLHIFVRYMCDHAIYFFMSILQSFTIPLPFFVGDFALTAKYPDGIGPVGWVSEMLAYAMVL